MLGSRENILKAKLEILEGLKPNGTLVINNDNDLLHKWYEEQNGKQSYHIVTYGMQEESNIMGKNAIYHENGSECEAIVEGKSYKIHIPVGGEHFVLNALCAISVGQTFSIPMEQIAQGIEEFELTKRRMEIKHTKEGALLINDCYNANYDSMKSSLRLFRKIAKSKKNCSFR